MSSHNFAATEEPVIRRLQDCHLGKYGRNFPCFLTKVPPDGSAAPMNGNGDE